MTLSMNKLTLLYQVIPFLLRRTKDEVLSDLPEKIIQDRYCNLSPLQLKLYDKFSSSNTKEEISTIVKANESEQSTAQPKATRHVFQVLEFNNSLLFLHYVSSPLIPPSKWDMLFVCRHYNTY